CLCLGPSLLLSVQIVNKAWFKLMLTVQSTFGTTVSLSTFINKMSNSKNLQANVILLKMLINGLTGL
ncbi:MAG: hypothetical protein FWH37_09485, partial [Candidatus Bathyarchaeota archaeon]|nr:hypothetical protein [Candidatus Termiticorpusculum sp.]